MKKFLNLVIFIASLVYVYTFVKNDINWEIFYRKLDLINYNFLSLALILSFLSLFIRASKLALIFNIRYFKIYGNLSRIFNLSNRGLLYSIIFPFRIGELFRIKLLSKSLNITFKKTLQLILVEKTIEGFVFIGIIAVFSPIIFSSIHLFILLIFGFLSVIAYILFKYKPEIITRLLIIEKNKLSKIVLLTILIFSVDCIIIAILSKSVNINQSFSNFIILIFSIYLAALLPTAPVQLGTLQGGVVFVLTSQGIPHEDAFLLSCLIQLSTIFPIFPLGLLGKTAIVIDGDQNTLNI